MANADTPFGLRPVRHLNGSSWNGATERCYVSANDGTALYPGDPVVIDATAANREDSGRCLTVIKATAGNGNYTTGVVISVEPNADTQLKYRAAATARYLQVCIDPTVIYHIQDDGGVASTDLWPGANGVYIFTHSGSAYTGLSGVELDSGSADAPAADASNQLIILQLADLPDNALGAHAIWEVMINLHTFNCSGDGDGMLGVIGA